VNKNAQIAQRQRLPCCEQRRFQDTLGLRHVHGVGLSEKNASRRGWWESAAAMVKHWDHWTGFDVNGTLKASVAPLAFLEL
jgi:hypothetical protein